MPLFTIEEVLEIIVEEALRKGAVGAVVARERSPDGEGRLILEVEDTLQAYQQLAAYHRSRFDIPVVAVTGSNGKTTTKEMVAGVLGERGRVLKTEGNLNNRIGVPRTLLQVTEEDQAAVIEMGVDQIGQTSRLCEVVRPTIGIITNIGPDHLELFGSLEASAQAKAELLDHLLPEDAVVLNADDAYFGYLAARARCRVLSFGLSDSAQVRAVDIVSDPDPAVGTRFRLQLPGRARHTPATLAAHGLHNVANALAAAAVGHLLSMNGTAIGRGLARFRPASMRSEVTAAGGVTIINDCYNANPASMKAAIDLLHALGEGRRTVAVLGDMLELGPTSAKLHREVGDYLGRKGVGYLIAVGELGRELAAGAKRSGIPDANISEVRDAAAAAHTMQALLQRGDVVLVKASRRLRLEQVLTPLKTTAESLT
jgi:UDP-N-acetylmuramoyl-tripeptide--D-alanyl-D-alanine ligase